MKPSLSVVIPCFKNTEYLSETVGSIARIGVKDLEVVLVDDGSPEPLEPKFATLRTEFPQLVIRTLQQSNGGPAKGRNTGIANALSDWIITLDSDDLLESASIPALLKEREKNPTVDIVYGDFKCFGERENYCPAIPWPKVTLARVNGLPYSALFRKALWEKVGGYDEVIPYGVEDWQFWIKSQHAGAKGHYVPTLTLHYRVREGSLTTGVNKDDLVMKASIIRSLPDAYSWTQQQWAELILKNREILDNIEIFRGTWGHRVGVMPSDSMAALDCALLRMATGEHAQANEWFVKTFAFDTNPAALVELDNYALALEKQLAEASR